MTPSLLREEIQGLREKWQHQPAPELYGELSDLLFKAGKIPAAMNLLEGSLNFRMSSMEEILGSSTASGPWWFSRGMEYADACLYEEAYFCLTCALNMGYENFETYYCLAGVEKSLGHLEEAKNHCLKSLECKSDFIPSLFLFGIIAKQEGRFNESIEALQKALLINPDCATAHYDLACYYTLAGMKEEGLATLEKALVKGFCDLEWLSQDPDLMGIRTQPGFSFLLQTYTLERG